jgi:hypothetical protein
LRDETPFCYQLDMAKISTKKQNDMPAEKFAFPKERKEPLTDASHVRNASARFNQVKGVSPEEKTQARKKIQSAAKKYGVELKKKPD